MSHDGKMILSVPDYVIFATLLLISTAIGVYFQFAGKKTKEDYLLAGRNMSLLPVTFSLMATFMSATNIMGLPADIYLHGTNLTFMNIGFIVGPILSAYVFLPVYFNNNCSTAYEYLEMRFGKFIRRFVSGMFAVQIVLFTAATLYAPALALSAVTDLSLWMSVIVIGTVCTFYCTLGGMKAVLWTDVFQAFLMYTTLIAIIVIGCIRLGGLSNIFKEANDGGRLVFPSLKLDFSKHYTVYNIFAQSMILILSSFGGSQISVQRLMAVKSLNRSRLVSILFIPMLVTFQLMCCMCGLIFYVYFRSCDPMTSPNKPIYSADQLMPYFITSTMGHLPGLPGLCIAGIFSASLSTVSSAINSLAAVTQEDFIQPCFPNIKNAVFSSKIISLTYGGVCIALSFLMASLGNLIKLSILIIGMFAGPNMAVFILASCTTAANQEGVLIGLIASLAVGSYLNFGPNRKPEQPLPLSNECDHLYPTPNTTAAPFGTISTSIVPGHNDTSWSITLISEPTEEEVFPVAYMWFSTVGLLLCLIVGYVSSLIVTFLKGKTSEVPESYLSPIRSWFIKKKCESKSTSVVATNSWKPISPSELNVLNLKTEYDSKL